MKLILGYTKIYLLELIRNKTALFFSVFFPAILLLCTENSYSGNARLITYIIYCHFAVQSVMFQALGIAIATCQENSWYSYLRTLPVAMFYSTLGRILAYLSLALLSLGMIVLINYQQKSVLLSFYQIASLS